MSEARRIFPSAILAGALLLLFIIVDPPVSILGWAIAAALGAVEIGIAFTSYPLWKKK